MASEEDLLDDTSYKEYGDLEDLDADAEEALLGTASDDELNENENYADATNPGEEVEYVDEEGNPIEIGEDYEVEYVDYAGTGQGNEIYDREDSVAEDVLDLAVDADLEFDVSTVQEEPEREPTHKSPRLPNSVNVNVNVGHAQSLPNDDIHHNDDIKAASSEERENADSCYDDGTEHIEKEVENSASDADEEDEEDEEEKETSGRGRFHSERPHVVSLSTAKKRTNIPDTLDGILQSNDSYRQESHGRGRRHRVNLEQVERSREISERSNKDCSRRSYQGNSWAASDTSRQDASLSSRSSHYARGTGTSTSSTSKTQSASLLGDPPNMLPCVNPARRDSKDMQGSRKILINPHFRGSLNATSRAQNWSEDRRGPPLLEAPPAMKQAAIANFVGPVIHQRPVEGSLPRAEHEQKEPFGSFSPPYAPSLPTAHYVRVPVPSIHQQQQQRGSQVLTKSFASVNIVSHSLGPPPPPPLAPPPPPPSVQYQPPVDVLRPPVAQQQQQAHHPNGPWIQNVMPPVTHNQSELKHGTAWTSPVPPMAPFTMASGFCSPSAQQWPSQSAPPLQQQAPPPPPPSQAYALPMEQHRQSHNQHPAISLPDMRHPPPNMSSTGLFATPVHVVSQQLDEIAAQWQDQMHQPKGVQRAPPIRSLLGFNHPPPPLLANRSPQMQQFLVGAVPPLRQMSPRSAINNPSIIMPGLRQRLPSGSDFRNVGQQKQSLSWVQPTSGISLNVPGQMNRKRPLNTAFALHGKVMKMSPLQQQAANRRQFQINSNIKEVPIVDILPTPVVQRVSVTKPSPKAEAPKQNAIVSEDEDDETRQYRQQIEMQKKQREEVLRIKEQRRQMMAFQRRKQLVEHQNKEGLTNLQQPIVGASGAVDVKNAADLQDPNLENVHFAEQQQQQQQQQQQPSLPYVGQLGISAVPRVKKQVVVRRVVPSMQGQGVRMASPMFLVQQPRLPVARAVHLLHARPRNPVSQAAARPALIQRVVPIKQNRPPLQKGKTIQSNAAPLTPVLAVASTSRTGPAVGQQSTSGVPARRVVRPSPRVVPNIVSSKFPVQAVNAEAKKAVVAAPGVQLQHQQQQQQQQKVVLMTQNVQQRTVIAGQVAKRTVIMSSTDAALVQSKAQQQQQQQQQRQQTDQPGGQQTQRCVLASKNLPARVRIDNLALSTSELDVHKLCKNVGPVEDVVLHRDRRTALVTFRNVQHAHEFMSKYQRRMLDLSLMNISMVT